MEGGNKLPKIFIIILGIIFVVLLAEGGYYLYGKRQKTSSTPQPTSEETTRDIITPSPGERYLRYDKWAYTGDSFQGYVPKSSFFLSATLNITVYGAVYESVFEDNVMGGKPNVYRLVLTNDKEQTLSYSFTRDELKGIKVVLRNSDGSKTPLELTDLAKDDKVIVRFYTDFLAGIEADTVDIEVSR